MRKENNKKTEEFLKQFTFKPIPTSMKDKICAGALQKQESNNRMAAFLWKGLVGCLLLLAVVIAVDATISHAQHKRFSSFLDQPQVSPQGQQEEWSMLQDIIWEPYDSSRKTLKKTILQREKKSHYSKRQLEWREIFEEEYE